MATPAKYPIIQLIPNLVTIMAIVAGLTAIRFGLEGNFERAVKLILLAAVLDGIDGSLARMLKSESKVGAELDSLADFLNFGVAPPLIMYFWALVYMRDVSIAWGKLGWMAAFIYVACAALRLARFNVQIEEVDKKDTNKYGIIAGKLVDGTQDTYRVTDMVEKPDPKDAPTNMAIIGRYILTPDIFDILRDTPAGKGGEIQITDALLKQAQKGKVIAFKFKGKRFDCGSVDGFVEATNYFYNKTKG